MAKNEPLITTIMTVYNGEAFLGEALEALCQVDYPNKETVIVDDGSTDNTAKILAGYPKLRVFQRPHSGLSAARNYAASEARGEFLNFCDADDLWPPDRLTKLYQPFLESPQTELVFGRVEEFGTGLQLERNSSKAGHFCGGMLIRRQAYDRVGIFREDLVVSEYMDWYLRAKELSLNMVDIDDVVVRRRIHGANHTVRNHHLLAQEYPRVLMASLKRRKEQTTT